MAAAFDELSMALAAAQGAPASRRAALRRVGGLLLGWMLASTGLDRLSAALAGSLSRREGLRCAGGAGVHSMNWLAFAVVGLLVASGAVARRLDPESERAALAALQDLEPVVQVDETRPGKPVIVVRFLPNFGRVTDDLLVHLRQFPELRVVELPNKRMITDAGLEQLIALRHLRRLQLAHTAITDAGLEHLKDLTELEELNVRGTGVSSEGLVRLKRRLPRLRTGGP